MRRKLYAALFILVTAGITTACGASFEADESTVYIKKDGNVIGADIEDFNKDYYDEEELKAYITESWSFGNFRRSLQRKTALRHSYI